MLYRNRPFYRFPETFPTDLEYDEAYPFTVQARAIHFELDSPVHVLLSFKQVTVSNYLLDEMGIYSISSGKTEIRKKSLTE